jgi:acetyltransferase-like isoleucine patch superfamily enzyme
MKSIFLKLWSIDSHIRIWIYFSSFWSKKIPFVGKIVSLILDRLLLIIYGLDLYSSSIDIKSLSIAHPVGVLLGGNGIFSPGRVAVMAGVKFVGRSPDDPEYLRRHRERRVFVLGDNVVIGAGSVLIGPLDICDNVMIGAMSLVNKSITEPGVYVGVPVKKISDLISDSWVSHL